MELNLKRVALKDSYTIGKLSINGTYFCDTLEDVVRTGAKIMHKTAIPYGRYLIDWTFSNRFGRYMPLLLKVPNFEGIRIHSGNTSEDTSGCILLGKNTEKGKVTNSRYYCAQLDAIIKSSVENKKLVYITIE